MIALGDRAADAADVVAPCAVDVDLYLDPLLENPPVPSRASRSTWQQYESLAGRARALCAACPVLDDCLYKAVVHTDVSGFVGCTTPAERKDIRRRIGVAVAAEDLDSWAGARGERQPVEHDDVLRVRAQHPQESLEWIAGQLGCSLSTVKRHLRRARREAGVTEPDADTPSLPTMEAVFEAFEAVVEPNAGARSVRPTVARRPT